jgi:hypothetical protein
MIASDITLVVSSQLNDVDRITWLEDALHEYLTTAEEQIVSIRPDSYSVVTTMQMVAGTKQSLPATALRLLDIKRNMGSDGLTPGRAVLVTDNDSLDLFEAGWNTAAQVAAIYNFIYDERTPNTFYVDPPSDGNGHLEISVSQIPPQITSENQPLVVKDIYRNALIQWCMFRAYSIEVDSASSQQRAAKHEKSFYIMMGKKFERDIIFSPSPEAETAAQ